MSLRQYPAQSGICSAIEITTETDKDKKRELFYLFQYLKEKSADFAQYFCLKYLLLPKFWKKKKQFCGDLKSKERLL